VPVLSVAVQIFFTAPGLTSPYYSFPVGSGPVSVAIGDLDGDRRPDLISANQYSNTVSVLRSLGGGRFDAQREIATDEGPVQVAVADLNGDEVADVVVASRSVGVFLGNGDGTFRPRADYALSQGASCVAIGDVNRDGRPDIVAGEWFDEVAAFPGNGDGTFGAPAYWNANPHGAPAAVPGTAGAPGSYRPRRGESTMKFVMIAGVAIGDLDGDGMQDIAVSLDDPYVTFMLQVLLGIGDGTFRQGGSIYDAGASRAIKMTDFNRDGRPDLAAVNSGDRAVSVILNPGNGTIGPPVRFPTRSDPIGVAAGDLNGDGSADLVSSNYRQEVCVWLGNGAGGFGAPAYFETGLVPYSVAIGDLDGDRRADLATADDSSNTVSVLFGDGTGRFGAAPTVTVPAESPSGALGLALVHPNPVATQATMRFTLPTAGPAALRVLDAAGRSVVVLEDGFLPAGDHVAHWDRRGLGGAAVPPGVYLCVLQFGSMRVSRRFALLR
jgi:hypothetical protein